MWGTSSRLVLAYPPCDVSELVQFPLDAPRRPLIVSLAQFRPEKNHVLQLESFCAFTKKYATAHELVVIGGCRNAADRKRARELQEKAKELGIAEKVVFEVDAGYDTIKRYLREGAIGLHTMVDEHFGISIIEFMVGSRVR